MTETILDESAVSEIEARPFGAMNVVTVDRVLLTPAERDALCATVKHLRAERLEIQRALASSVLNDPTEDDDPPYSTTELVEGVRFILKMKEAKVARVKDLQSQLEQLRAENERLTESLNKTNTLGEEMLTRMEKVAGIGTKADHGWYYVIEQVEAKLAQVEQERDRFSELADSSSLPNDLTASRDAAVAAALTRLLADLESLTLDQVKPGEMWMTNEKAPERIWIDTDDVAGAQRRGVGSYYVRPAPDDASNREAEYVRADLVSPASAAPVVDDYEQRGEIIPEEEIQAAIAASKERLHWPFTAKHDNCAECDKEYEAPPAAATAAPVVEKARYDEAMDDRQKLGHQLACAATSFEDAITKLKAVVRNAQIRVGASANCYNEPKEAQSGADYVANRVLAALESVQPPIIEQSITPTECRLCGHAGMLTKIEVCTHHNLTKWRLYDEGAR